ncbi:MAG: rhodanese-like domain-containing protein [Lachnospiraceae bacterium]|jgi:rhodanese-related sulfurtransferase|nr:rhodanese-like domain-containing protein [Lachnospiraceae bacterium]
MNKTSLFVMSTVILAAFALFAGCDSYVNQVYSGDLPDVTYQRDWSEPEPAAATPAPAERPESRPAEALPDPTQTPALAEYRQMSPAEAIFALQFKEVLVLDVRSQEEYDSGFIARAICLPAPDVAANIASLAPGLDTEILVYCQTGVRSEAAARELQGLGYTQVYDLGGIADWPYEIYLADTDYVYFNYYGNLPGTSEVWFDYATAMRVHDSLPEFTVCVQGYITYEYEMSYTDDTRYFRRPAFCDARNVIIQAGDGSFYQEFNDLSTGSLASEYNMYGLVFDDWNFDGYQDLALWRYMGGSSGNNPHYYWLWDNEMGMFAENDVLMQISDIAGITINADTKELEVFANFGAEGYEVHYAEYRDGEFVWLRSERFENDW